MRSWGLTFSPPSPIRFIMLCDNSFRGNQPSIVWKKSSGKGKPNYWIFFQFFPHKNYLCVQNIVAFAALCLPQTSIARESRSTCRQLTPENYLCDWCFSYTFKWGQREEHSRAAAASLPLPLIIPLPRPLPAAGSRLPAPIRLTESQERASPSALSVIHFSWLATRSAAQLN